MRAGVCRAISKGKKHKKHDFDFLSFFGKKSIPQISELFQSVCSLRFREGLGMCLRVFGAALDAQKWISMYPW